VLGEKRKRKPSSKAQGQQDEATQRAAKAAAVPARQPYMRWNDELDSVIVSFAEAAAATSLDCAAVLSALKAHPDCPPAPTTAAQVASRIGALRKRGVLAALPDKPSAGADLPFLPEEATLESVTAHINVHMRTFFGGVTANHTVPLSLVAHGGGGSGCGRVAREPGASAVVGLRLRVTHAHALAYPCSSTAPLGGGE
jgi:hypothetical protein